MRGCAVRTTLWVVIGSLLATPAIAATRYVATTGSDSNNTCLTTPCATVHHAVEVAAAGDVISIGPGEFIEGDQIVLSKALTVKGAGPLNTAVIAINAHRVFKVEKKVEAEISGLDIRGGDVTDACVEDCAFGGGVYNRGTLTLKNVHIRQNRGTQGGGLLNDNGATLSMIDALVQDNVATFGGGIVNASATASIEDSYILGNASTSSGGGILNNGTLTLSRVLIESNTTSADGGGVNTLEQGVAYLRNTTLSGNSAALGGGAIWARGFIELTHATIADNGAPDGATGGIVVDEPLGYASLRNTIVANNSGRQCERSFKEANLRGKTPPLVVEFGGAGNMISDTSCNLWPKYNLVADPVLGPLAYNGGKTPTYSLLPASPAIDAANKWFCVGEDQRGFTRPIDGNGNGQATCDIGAFEYGSTTPATKATTKGTQKGPLFPAGIGGATAPRR